MPPHGKVRFHNRDARSILDVQIGDGSPTVEDGYGGWEVTARPGRTALTTWAGYAPIGISIPLIFDGLRDELSMESDILKLEQMAGRGGTKFREPPVIGVDGGGLIPHVQPGDDGWIIEEIGWGDAVRDNAGRRIRQDATVKILQFVEAADVRKKSIRIRNSSTVITTKKGDTLRKLASRWLGNSNRFLEISRVNRGMTRTGRKVLRTGTRVVIPPKAKS